MSHRSPPDPKIHPLSLDFPSEPTTTAQPLRLEGLRAIFVKRQELEPLLPHPRSTSVALLRQGADRSISSPSLTGIPRPLPKMSAPTALLPFPSCFCFLSLTLLSLSVVFAAPPWMASRSSRSLRRRQFRPIRVGEPRTCPSPSSLDAESLCSPAPRPASSRPRSTPDASSSTPL